jgi:hypothetical protein
LTEPGANVAETPHFRVIGAVRAFQAKMPSYPNFPPAQFPVVRATFPQIQQENQHG